MNNFALIGKSLKHSLSKELHEKIFEKLNIKASYSLCELEEDDLDSFILKLKNGLYAGINITIPYKKDLIKYLDYIDPRAQEIGSINTIKVLNGKLLGYNTDYYGFIKMLDAYKIKPLNKACYILGTGGVSLTVEKALKDLGAKSVSFVSRSKRANNIISYEDLKNKKIDLLINATPVGTYPNNSENPLPRGLDIKEVVDLIYNPKRTQLLKDYNSLNNGLPMLVYQAIRAEEIWLDLKIAENIIKEVGGGLESIWK